MPIAWNAPTASKVTLAPRLWPGRTPQATKALTRILEENHNTYELIFGGRFHNHLSHTTLALWALGAPESIIQASWDRFQKCLEPMNSTETSLVITKDNWKDHVGDEKHYQPYLKFFRSEVGIKGMDAVLEEYVFAPEANAASGSGRAPEMFNRNFDGLLHPMIHAGYGLEFNMPGIFAEGMASIATHTASSTGTIPPSSLEAGAADPKGSLDIFTILGRIIGDEFKVTAGGNLFQAYGEIMGQQGREVKALIEEWDLSGPVEKAIEELVWITTIIFGIVGRETDSSFNADFFFMHFVTSALFLPIWLERIKKPEIKRTFLRGYLSVVLVTYMARGKPVIDIHRFFADSTTLRPTAPGAHPSPALETAKGVPEADAINPNPWIQIIQSTLVHPDEHVPKIQRALAHFDELYGDTEKGRFKNSKLEGAEDLDGSLFLRVAGLTMTRNRWVREGEEIKTIGTIPPVEIWDFRGFAKKY
ncbi:hypothetical protein DFP72DRAFT_899250 [Ephemerocybe angulata]|uniref:Oxidoreductase AflY n=1 Tax=Ephemerocybe angulata TaxID=980116 RepID=A0A8H6HWH7_9AGAR|nr:hypothetical protein DFP72DRAFT_899250 [Tulosesus angulatus]